MVQRIRSSKSVIKSSKSRKSRKCQPPCEARCHSDAAGGDLSPLQNRPLQRRRRPRRASQRDSSAATRALYAEAGISTASKRDRRTALKLSAVHLDDVELDTAWQAAIRGDYITASDRLNRTIKQTRMHPRKRKPKGWTPWRTALLPQRK